MTDPAVNPLHEMQQPSLQQLDVASEKLSPSQPACDPTPTVLDPALEQATPAQIDREDHLPQVQGYEVLSRLGQGGMGVVFRARHERLNRMVALKMIRDGLLGTPTHLARFHSEARAVARLQHPHIVQIFEIGEHQGRPYFALELVEGGNLSQQLAKSSMSLRAVADLIEKLARAIHYAHTQGIIHRDLKPANLLLTPEGGLKVVDFGLAKESGTEIFLSHSCTDSLLGTPSYMAPEQAWGPPENVGPRSDVYSIGAILYECLTGKPPFLAGTLLEVLDQLRHRDPVPPTHINPEVPRDLETICLKCLGKMPAHRYASALDLADDLARFLGGEPIQARRVSTAERAWKWMRRRPALTALSGLVLVLVALTLSGLWYATRWAKIQQETARADVNRAHYSTLLQQTQQAIAQQRFDTALRLLEECPVDVRGWEWDLLMDLAQGHMPPRLAGLKQPVQALAFDSRQGYLYAATESGLRAWNQTTLEELPTLATGGRVRGLTLSPSGRYLAALVEPTVVPAPVRIPVPNPLHWFTPVPTLLRIIPEFQRGVALGTTCTMPQLVPEAKSLPGTGPIAQQVAPPAVVLVPTRRDEVLVWDLQTRKLIIRWICPSGGTFQAPTHITFHPKTSQLAVLASVRTAFLHPPQAPLRGLLPPNPVSEVEFPCCNELTPAGPKMEVPVAFSSSLVAFFDLRQPTIAPRVVPLEGEICHCLAYSPDGGTLCLGSLQGEIRLLDPATGKVCSELRSPAGGQVVSLAFNSDGTQLASGTAEGQVDIWDFQTSELRHMLPAHAAPVRELHFHQSGNRLCTLGEDGYFKIWDTASGQGLLTTRMGPAPHHPAMALDPTGKVAAVANFSEENGFGVSLFGMRAAGKPQAWQAHPCEMTGAKPRRTKTPAVQVQRIQTVPNPTPVVPRIAVTRDPEPSLAPQAPLQVASPLEPADPVPQQPEQPAHAIP